MTIVYQVQACYYSGFNLTFHFDNIEDAESFTEAEKNDEKVNQIFVTRYEVNPTATALSLLNRQNFADEIERIESWVR